MDKSVYQGESKLSLIKNLSGSAVSLPHSDPLADNSPISRLIAGHLVVVDAQDAYLLDAFKWHVDTHSYVAANSYSQDKGRHTVLLHRLIACPPDGFEVDHADGDKLNNTRANLRVCTRSQNHANRRKFKNCSSQYKGVSLNKAFGNWRASIKENGKLRYLGTFALEVDAARAYDREAVRIHGEFARLNFPDIPHMGTRRAVLPLTDSALPTFEIPPCRA
jgi:hypothetical protein